MKCLLPRLGLLVSHGWTREGQGLQTGDSLGLKQGGSVLFVLMAVEACLLSPRAPGGKAAQPAGAPSTNDCLGLKDTASIVHHLWAQSSALWVLGQGLQCRGAASAVTKEATSWEGKSSFPGKWAVLRGKCQSHAQGGRAAFPSPRQETQIQGQERSAVVWFCLPDVPTQRVPA